MKKTLLALASVAVFGSASAIAGTLTCYTAPTMPYGFCFDPQEITAVGASLYAVRLGMSTAQGVGDTGATLTVNCQTRAMQAWDMRGTSYYVQEDPNFRNLSDSLCAAVR